MGALSSIAISFSGMKDKLVPHRHYWDWTKGAVEQRATSGEAAEAPGKAFRTLLLCITSQCNRLDMLVRGVR